MTFPEALEAMKTGTKTRRAAWRENLFLAWFENPAIAGIAGETLYVHVPDGEPVWQPWQPTTEDIMADDWETIAI